MSTAGWRSGLRHGVQRLGVAASIGIALLVLAVAVQALIHRSLDQRRTALQADVAAARTAAEAARRSPPTRQLSTREQLRAFYARFPRPEAAAQALAQVNEAAIRSGLSLQSGEYRMEQRPEDALRRYRVILPVQGRYAQLRAFIDQVLVDLPSAALDEVEMRRDASAGADVQARVHLTLYLQGRP